MIRDINANCRTADDEGYKDTVASGIHRCDESGADENSS